MNKTLVIPVVAIVLGTAVILTATQTYAQTTTNTKYPSIIQKLVAKFGLKESEVQAVFDEERSQHKTEMRTNVEERLTQAVAEGKLTEAQKQAILAKHAELQTKREATREEFKTLTKEQRQERMTAEKAELEKWASDNGIDLKKFWINHPIMKNMAGRRMNRMK